MTVRVRVRVWVDAKLIVREDHEVDPASDQLAQLAARHAEIVSAFDAKPYLVEFEILDDPDDPDRFLRFGTDSRGMVDPIPWDNANH